MVVYGSKVLTCAKCGRSFVRKVGCVLSPLDLVCTRCQVRSVIQKVFGKK